MMLLCRCAQDDLLTLCFSLVRVDGRICNVAVSLIISARVSARNKTLTLIELEIYYLISDVFSRLFLFFIGIEIIASLARNSAAFTAELYRCARRPDPRGTRVVQVNITCR
jgi:hypothetical protein